MSERTWERELQLAVRNAVRLDPLLEAEYHRRHDTSGVWRWLARNSLIRRLASGVFIAFCVAVAGLLLTGCAMFGYATWQTPPFESSDIAVRRAPLEAIAVQAIWLLGVIPCGVLVVAPSRELTVECYLPLESPSRRAPWSLAWLAIPLASFTCAGWWPLWERLRATGGTGEWLALAALFAIQLAFIPALAVVWLGVWRGPWWLVLVGLLFFLLLALPAGMAVTREAPWAAYVVAVLPTGWVTHVAWLGVVEGQVVAWAWLAPVLGVIAVAVTWLARGLEVEDIQPGGRAIGGAFSYRFGWARNRVAARPARRPARSAGEFAGQSGETTSGMEAARERLAALWNAPGLNLRRDEWDRWFGVWYGERDRDIQRALTLAGGSIGTFAWTHALAAVLVVGGSELSWFANIHASSLPPEIWGPRVLSFLLLVPYLVAYGQPLVWRGAPPEALASSRRAWRYAPLSLDEVFRAERRCTAVRVAVTLPVTLGLACAGVGTLGISWQFALDCALRGPALIVLWAPVRTAIATESPTGPVELLNGRAWRRIGLLLLFLGFSTAFLCLPTPALRGFGQLSLAGLPAAAWGLVWVGRRIERRDDDE